MAKIRGILAEQVLRHLIREAAMSITRHTPAKEKTQKLAWIMDLRKELQTAAAINRKRLQEKAKRKATDDQAEKEAEAGNAKESQGYANKGM